MRKQILEFSFRQVLLQETNNIAAIKKTYKNILFSDDAHYTKLNGILSKVIINRRTKFRKKYGKNDKTQHLSARAWQT